jgi:glycine oxidase
MEACSDAVIIGGGVIGLTCAWKLAESGLKVAVVERNKCGQGASGSSLGVLWPPSPLRKGPFYDLHRKSLEQFESYTAQIREKSGISPGYVYGRCLKYFLNQAQRDRAVREVREETEGESDHKGMSMELLTEAQAREIEPQIAGMKFGALLSHSAGSIIVSKLLQGLEAVCRQAGIVFRENSEATAIETEQGRVTAVCCKENKIACRIVLAAAGAWNSLIHEELERITPVEPVRGQALRVRTKGRILRKSNMVRTRRVYLIPESNYEVIIGSTTEQESGYFDNVTLGSISELMTAAQALAPDLKEAVLLECWSGLRPSSVKNRPYIGSLPGVEGLYTASGHYKTGIALAPITGEIINDLVVNGRTDLDIESVLPRE